MELAFYKGERFRIARKNKPMAWLVGEPFMEAISKVIDYIIENEPALADSLAISLDEEINTVINKGTEAVKKEEFIPLATILDE